MRKFIERFFKLLDIFKTKNSQYFVHTFKLKPLNIKNF